MSVLGRLCLGVCIGAPVLRRLHRGACVESPQSRRLCRCVCIGAPISRRLCWGRLALVLVQGVRSAAAAVSIDLAAGFVWAASRAGAGAMLVNLPSPPCLTPSPPRPRCSRRGLLCTPSRDSNTVCVHLSEGCLCFGPGVQSRGRFPPSLPASLVWTDKPNSERANFPPVFHYVLLRAWRSEARGSQTVY